MRGNASFGTVAGISEPVAHKPPGAGSSLLSSKGFSATAGTAKCTDSHRQHVCGFVYKSSRRVEIAPLSWWHKMDERTDRDSDAVAAATVSRLVAG